MAGLPHRTQLLSGAWPSTQNRAVVPSREQCCWLPQSEGLGSAPSPRAPRLPAQPFASVAGKHQLSHPWGPDPFRLFIPHHFLQLLFQPVSSSLPPLSLQQHPAAWGRCAWGIPACSAPRGDDGSAGTEGGHHRSACSQARAQHCSPGKAISVSGSRWKRNLLTCFASPWYKGWRLARQAQLWGRLPAAALICLAGQGQFTELLVPVRAGQRQVEPDPSLSFCLGKL